MTLKNIVYRKEERKIMEILNVKIESERKRALELCKNLMEKHALIPIVGSGFSFGAPTDKGGTIPSVEQLRKKLCSYISKYSCYHWLSGREQPGSSFRI